MCQVPDGQVDDLQPEAELAPAGGAAGDAGLAVRGLHRRDQAALPAARGGAGGHPAQGGAARQAALRPGAHQEPPLASGRTEKTTGKLRR